MASTVLELVSTSRALLPPTFLNPGVIKRSRAIRAKTHLEGGSNSTSIFPALWLCSGERSRHKGPTEGQAPGLARGRRRGADRGRSAGEKQGEHSRGDRAQEITTPNTMILAREVKNPKTWSTFINKYTHENKTKPPTKLYCLTATRNGCCCLLGMAQTPSECEGSILKENQATPK